MRYSEIEKIAFDLIVKHKAMNSGKKNYEVNLDRLTNALNIEVHTKNLGGEISGLLVIKNGRASIGLDSNQSPERRRFTIAHELGHFFLHRTLKETFVDEVFARSGNSNQIEREANAFAAALLMPKKFIDNAINENFGDKPIRDEEIAILANFFNVSGVSMTYRLVNLNIIEQPYF